MFMNSFRTSVDTMDALARYADPCNPLFQEQLLRMAMVAAGIGNGGVVMRPNLIRRVVTDAGFTGFRRATETPFNLVYEAPP